MSKPLEIKPLTALIIEVTNRCNLTCEICPVNTGLMKRPKAEMTQEVFHKIVSENPGLQHITFHNWGEPLLNRSLFAFISLAREYNPDAFLSLSTNGTLLDDANIAALLDSDLTRIQFSIDGLSGTYERIRGFNYEKLVANIEKLLDQNLDHPKRKLVAVSMVLNEDTEREYERFQTRWEGKVDFVRAQPMVQYRSNDKRSHICSFLATEDYGRLVVLSDGTIVPCCVDFDGELSLGNIKDTTLRAVWNGKALRELRESHLEGVFPRICSACVEFESEHVPRRF